MATFGTAGNNLIRVSAAGLCRIGMNNGFLLSLNKSRLAKRIRNFTPFGGAIEFNESAKPFLKELGVIFEKGNDLRFTIPENNLAELEKWFYLRTEREISPFRELQEELVEEEKVLPNLPPTAVRSEYLWTIKPARVGTDRPGQEGMITQRYFEIFNIVFTPEVYENINNHLGETGSRLAVLTAEEILAGKLNIGEGSIGTNCRYLIEQER